MLQKNKINSFTRMQAFTPTTIGCDQKRKEKERNETVLEKSRRSLRNLRSFSQ